MISARGLPLAAAVQPAFRGAVVLEGVSQAAGTFAVAPISKAGELDVHNLASGNTVLTLAMTLVDLIASDNPGNSSIQVRTEAIMGYTRTVGKELSFNACRNGDGLLAVNFTDGAVVDNWNDVDPVSLPKWGGVVNFRTYGVANRWIAS